ncbi:uncharacterized protein LOC144097493 [Amblyomma americanum]
MKEGSRTAVVPRPSKARRKTSRPSPAARTPTKRATEEEPMSGATEASTAVIATAEDEELTTTHQEGIELTTPSTSTLNRIHHPLVVCIVGEQLRRPVSPPAGLCHFVVFADVKVRSRSEDFVAVSNQAALDAFLEMAAGGHSSAQFLLSLSANADFYDSLEVRKRAVPIMRRYLARNVSGYGFARHRVDVSSGDAGNLWKHHVMLFYLRHWAHHPLTVFLGLQLVCRRSYVDDYVTGLVAEAAASVDFIILVTHSAPPTVASSPKRCQVEPISSWEPLSFQDKRTISMHEATSILSASKLERHVQVPLLLSLSLAVVQYEVERDHSVEQPRLGGLRCSNASLLPFAEVCLSSSTYMTAGHEEYAFCHYEDDPVHGRWRTYITSADMTKAVGSVARELDPPLAFIVGWAFYDLELEDHLGNCTSYWGTAKAQPNSAQSFAYFRLRNAVQQIEVLKRNNAQYLVPNVENNITDVAPACTSKDSSLHSTRRS